MGTYTVIPESTFEEMQLDAGVLLTSFNPAAPSIVDSAILCATTGGINIVAEPTFSDLGEDVDNVAANMKELKHLDSWDCRFETTGLGTSPELIKKGLGCADISGTGSTKICPRKDLSQGDFANALWWVGDKANGGFVAVKLINALSTGGFSLQTTKAGKGQISLTFTGHVSINAQNVVPIEFYSIDEPAGAYGVEQNLIHITSSFTDNTITSGSNFSAVLTAEEGYSIVNVIVMYNGADVTSSKYTSGTHTVAINSVAGDIEIIATANES